ncbi:MAG: hypothetical protein H6735_18025 [Alphaproteobacteria bacterium]|nr:hypothetical protein [Alphaproteobacteria bacterium]
MNRLIAGGLAASFLMQGCVVYSRDVDVVQAPPDQTVVIVDPPVIVNYSPYVEGGDAFVWFDPAYHDDVVSFTAIVDDPDGVQDVLGVWADIYDDWAGGQLVASVELVPTSDPYVWIADVSAHDLWVDPYWAGYSVDIVVYDWYEDFGWITVPLETYGW